jgi:hypothetical protein
VISESPVAADVIPYGFRESKTSFFRAVGYQSFRLFAHQSFGSEE